MDQYTATEQAFKNGFEEGFKYALSVLSDVYESISENTKDKE